ncbi:hypothetical protein [Oceanicaulis sp. MMSF_3324]|uniref:hypothetical protein n=1 Tax=Oceanicaulis sp. MMSF_3324 TaxID=3046702 RepID=UPI00273E74D8|nr:hypothetical protein [Oceanicaulis sp. MMSF_3324]
MTAPLTGKGPLGFAPIPFGRSFALGAGMALAETHIEQLREARLVIGELAEEILGRLLHAHNAPYHLPYGKKIMVTIFDATSGFSDLELTTFSVTH